MTEQQGTDLLAAITTLNGNIEALYPWLKLAAQCLVYSFWLLLWLAFFGALTAFLQMRKG